MSGSEGQQTPTSSGKQGELEEATHSLHTISDYSEKEEKRLVRKIDWLLLPTLTILYLLSFLDRSNIGNAKIEGLVTDLKIKDYSTLLTIYFIGYVLAELPCNWILKITTPTFWLPTLTLLWGIVSVCMGLVHNEAGMYATRFFLGITEAGLFPGVLYVFSRFYKRAERTARVSFFFSAAAASGAFGGILAFLISKMDGLGNKPGWAWIFIIEGLLTVVISALSYFIVPNYPLISHHFTKREKEVIHSRLQHDSDALENEAFQWSEVWKALTSIHVYAYCFLFHGFAFGLYTLSLFLPSIIQQLGFQSWEAQLLSTPPYVFAFIVTMSTAYFSNKVGKRAPFIIASALVAIVGYIALITSPTVAGKYTAVHLCAAGIYAGNALLLAWPSENLMGQTYRATALAMVISIGDVGAIIGTQLYRTPLGSISNPNYDISHIFTIVWLCIGGICALGLWIGLSKANQKLKREKNERKGVTTKTSEKEEDEKWKKDFMYQV